MKQLEKENLMIRRRINTRPIMLVFIGLCFLTAILAATVMASFPKLRVQNGMTGTNNKSADAGKASDSENGGTILAVVENIDSNNKQITLYDINKGIALVLSYTGGTNITDKYDRAISMSQIDVGIMVDASYEPAQYKLNRMNISKKAWEYPRVNNLTVDDTQKIMQIASDKYKYTDDLFVLNGDDSAHAVDLTEQDVMTIWGYEETIWSVVVTTGHGTVKLKDYEEYLGDMISIGNESMLQITDDFAVTVREGTFNLTVENGRYSATKSITVLRNKDNYVSLADLGPVGVKQGLVTFDITPFGADLFIDGKEASYSGPIELDYGVHTVKASLGGYTTYNDTVEVDSEEKTIKINLPEAIGDKNVEVTETDTGSDNNSSGNAGTDTAASPSGDNTSKDNPDNSSDDVKYSHSNTDYTLNDGDSLDSKHMIYIKAPEGASVYLNGEFMGTSPCSFNKIIGNHVLTFIKDGYHTMSYTVEVKDDKQDVKLAFPPLTKSK